MPAKWLTAAGTDLSSSARADIDHDPPDGSSFPWWALVAGALVGGGGVVFAVRANSRP